MSNDADQSLSRSLIFGPGYQDGKGAHNVSNDADGRGEDEGYTTLGVGDVLTAFAYAFLIMVVVLNIDVFMSRWGVGTIGWSGKSEVQNTDMVEVHFCRITHQGVATSPRIWSYMSSNRLGACDTEVLTLTAGVTEVSKLTFADDNIFSNENIMEEHTQGEAKFMGGVVASNIENEVTPDALAEERKLRQPGGNSMHAGFGGLWRRIM